jgi:hypothetical protein
MKLLEALCWVGLVVMVTYAAIVAVNLMDAPTDDTEYAVVTPYRGHAQ